MPFTATLVGCAAGPKGNCGDAASCCDAEGRGGVPPNLSSFVTSEEKPVRVV